MEKYDYSYGEEEGYDDYSYDGYDYGLELEKEKVKGVLMVVDFYIWLFFILVK